MFELETIFDGVGYALQSALRRSQHTEPELQFHAPSLPGLDAWEEDVLLRYPDPEAIATTKTAEEYRNYDSPVRDTVKEFYRLNHTYQTYDFVRTKQKEFLQFNDRLFFNSFSKKNLNITL